MISPVTSAEYPHKLAPKLPKTPDFGNIYVYRRFCRAVAPK